MIILAFKFCTHSADRSANRTGKRRAESTHKELTHSTTTMIENAW